LWQWLFYLVRQLFQREVREYLVHWDMFVAYYIPYSKSVLPLPKLHEEDAKINNKNNK
jgi:hypothetical protein